MTLVLQRLSSRAGRDKSELATSSSGTTSDGGWRRWWAAEAESTGTDWKSLLGGTNAALNRLQIAQGSSSL
jgi:hypothetical protein